MSALADPGSTIQPQQPDGTLTIAVRPGGQPNAEWSAYTGWTRTRVTTGIEMVPADFELEATEPYPGSSSQVEIAPGMECQILIGAQLQPVLSGYVDRVSYVLSGNSHAIRIQGRSKCADLVDCSAEFSTFQMNNTDPLLLAQKLAAPFGINAYAIGDIGSTQVPQFDVILTETPFEIIERVARYAALLVYDDHAGDLILSRAGSLEMASGFAQGVNVQQAQAAFTMDERYSTVEAVLQSTAVLMTDPGDPDAPTATQELSMDAVQGALAVDAGVPRYRPLIIVAEQGDAEYTVAAQRCQWEVSRRYGRSQAVQIVADSWFDSAGNLWQKNAIAPIDIPALKITGAKWIIGSVSYLRDEGGTHVEVTLMPPQAFQPEPIILQPYASDVYQAMNPPGGAQ
jgi:prophage tail gpP-like protein